MVIFRFRGRFVSPEKAKQFSNLTNVKKYVTSTSGKHLQRGYHPYLDRKVERATRAAIKREQEAHRVWLEEQKVKRKARKDEEAAYKEVQYIPEIMRGMLSEEESYGLGIEDVDGIYDLEAADLTTYEEGGK